MNLPFDNCEVIVEPEEVKTIFDDGLFYNEPLNLITPERLFYTREVGEHSVDDFIVNNHLLHTFLMEKFNFKYSPYFYNLAHGLGCKAEFERAMVLSFHKYLCINQLDPILIDIKEDIKGFKKEATRIIIMK